MDRPTLGPKIVVIDQLASQIAELESADQLSLHFTLYHAYAEVFGSDAEPFEDFVKWSNRLLQDYNEIDRYLVNAKDLYSNVSDAKTLERWGVEGETPELVDVYLRFWNRLFPLYQAFNKALRSAGVGYQGMIYRQAADKLKDLNAWKSVLNDYGAEHAYFIGFNALNEAEISMMQSALMGNLADVYFDVDSLYFDDYEHEAGMFLRRYANWPYFQNREMSFVRDSLRNETRTIELVGVPGNVGMAKAMSHKLREYRREMDKGEITDKLALVLADESLLLPVLNSIPEEFDEVNVTMGLSLKDLVMANTLESLIEAQERAWRLQNLEGRKYQLYHSDIERLVLQPFGKFLLGENGGDKANALIAQIRKYNAPFLSIAKLREWLPESELFFSVLEEKSPSELLEACAQAVAKYHDDQHTSIEDVEVCKRIFKVLLKLKELYHQFELEPNLTTTLQLFRQLQREESLDFYGEPLNGLQVMGVLETRLLGFENVVMTSVNEEILPAGKSENSFIPYDIKRAFGMPTYKEKDAIYAYHFYRLLQGSKNVCLLYNSESKAIGSGEASRFIEQIRREFSEFKSTTIVESVFSSPVKQDQLVTEFQMQKGEFLEEAFRSRAERGIAPSHLQTYVKSPELFYKQVILGMSEADEVEEVMGDRTMGLTVHKVLEDFYRPYENTEAPTDEEYASFIDRLPKVLEETYLSENKKPLEYTGQNGLVAHAMKEMTLGFMVAERKRAQEYRETGIRWQIVGVEEQLSTVLEVEGVSYPIKVKGTADRIDLVGDTYVVIDYKTGMASSGDVTVSDLALLAEKVDKGKGLQLFTYAYLLHKSRSTTGPVEAGIFALRDNKSGLVKAGIKEGRSAARTGIYSADLQTFEGILSSMLQEIFQLEGVFEPLRNPLEVES